MGCDTEKHPWYVSALRGPVYVAVGMFCATGLGLGFAIGSARTALERHRAAAATLKGVKSMVWIARARRGAREVVEASAHSDELLSRELDGWWSYTKD
jgi:hypothetical protein